MSSQNAWTAMSAPPPAGGVGDWATRPRYAPSDFVTLLWRQRWLMLGVFAAIMALGLVFALSLKTSYQAHSSVLVRLGQEYVYEPRIGDAARGAVPDTDQVIQTEVEILNSDALRQRVIDGIGFTRLFPKQASKWTGASPSRKAELMAQAVTSLGTGLKVESAPDTSVIRVTYEDDSPETAALVLNRLIKDYLIYRKQVLIEGAGPAAMAQQQDFQRRLDEANMNLQTFLDHNNISDFDAQKSSLNALQTSLTDESYRVQARLKEVEGRLAELARQAGAVPAEIGLYRDANPAASDKLLQLKLAREDLLSRYKPGSQPVLDINQQIAQVEKLLADGRGASTGASRTGVNPVYQTVQTERIQLSAEAASLRDRQGALNKQLPEITAERMRLSELEPRYQTLVRDRDILAANVRDLASKVEADAAAKALAQGANDTIRVVEKASAPTKGKSLRKPVAILAFLFAGFSALCVGLLRVFLTPGLPTPASAARTFDLPVLATAGYKEARRA